MAGTTLRIGLAGCGKIAQDQHVPAIAADPAFTLVATADPIAKLPGIAAFDSLEAMIAGGVALDAVAICTPPAMRLALATAAIEAGLHVLVEKPPATDIVAVKTMADLAKAHGVTLFTAWHSREASGIDDARAWLAGRRITRVTIDWKEDIRQWHPGQDWLLAASGFGIFDPAINAFSIITVLLDAPVTVEQADLSIPDGRGSPIAATVWMRSGETRIQANLDFLHEGEQFWTISIDTDEGTLLLQDGGQVVVIDGVPRRGENKEYARLYRRFANLAARGDSDVDDAPLRLVIDALRIGVRTDSPAFDW